MIKKNWKKILLAIILLGIIAIYFLNPTVNNSVNNAIDVLKSGNIDRVVEYIRSYGNVAAVISFLLMVLQSLLAPIPAFLITFANAMIFGWWKGAILSFVSSMVGAVLCFYIARVFGRDVVVKFTSNSALNEIEKYFEKYGSKTILICRLLPFISFDLVSYFAGLTSMSLPAFLLATGLGQLPATIIYSYVGGMLTGGAKLFVTALFLIFALSVLVVIIKQIFNERNKNNEHKEIDNKD